MSDLLDNLNPRQREAVTHRDGPLLILAGAGSGKTRVITHRIAWLVREAGVHPSEILAVTFTNKAAGEMRERVHALLGARRLGVWVSTFHSAGLRLLREHGVAIGLSPNLVVYDDSDQLSLMTRTMKSMDVDTKNLPPRSVRSRVDFAKSCGLGPDEMEIDEGDLSGKKIVEIYGAYQKALRAAGAVDFGDLILETVRLLREKKEILSHLQRRFRYLMVDEFQDTSPVQYELVRLLAGKRGNLAVVGDDDQSIYSWRGADVRNILAFESDYPSAKVVRLEQNYRSTQVILDAAHAVIRRSPTRKEKRLFTEQGGGEQVRSITAYDEVEEARLVAGEVEKAVADGYGRESIAIFYRVNAMSRAIEDALRERRIPYQVVRGRSFYDRAEIKDLTAYLRLAVNPDSDADMLRVINTPRRGIGARTIERLQRAASAKGTSIWGVLSSSELPGEIGPKPTSKLRELSKMLEGLHEMTLSSRQADDVVREALRGSGYIEALEKEDTPEAKERIENLTELLAVATQRAGEGQTLVELLDEMALVGDADYERDPDRVSLMTLHAAKGLEFDVAIVTGMEEQTLPHVRAFCDGGWSEDPDSIAEERRLCYVGFTRARHRLILGRARSRWTMGQRQVRGASRFLEEIPRELIEGGGSLLFGRRPAGEIGAGASPPATSIFEADDPGDGELVIDYSCDQRPADEGGLRPRPGGRVLHRSFGEGEIREVDGFGHDARLVVCFEGAGVKKILARYLEVL